MELVLNFAELLLESCILYARSTSLYTLYI